MNYQEIEKVNSEINMIDLKGKNYAMVPERVTAFRKLFPEGFIQTELISLDNGVAIMQAKAGYYKAGEQVILATGYAQEKEGFGMVNKTSFIENCETSAVGRCLGMIGLGINGGGICSAEELANAVVAQGQMKEKEKFTNPPMAKGQVEKVEKLPNVPNPTLQFISTVFGEIRNRLGLTDQEVQKMACDHKADFVKKKMIPDKPIKDYTLAEAEEYVDLLFKAVGLQAVKGA